MKILIVFVDKVITLTIFELAFKELQLMQHTTWINIDS